MYKGNFLKIYMVIYIQKQESYKIYQSKIMKGSVFMELTVKVILGEVYINGEFVRQLCWDAESIGAAVTAYLEDEER